MITQKQAEEIVKRYSPTTRVIVNDSDSMDGIYLQKTNTISIAHNWSVAGLLHEITHAVLILKGRSTGHDGVFADRFTKIVDDYYGEQIERLQEQLHEANDVIKKYATGTFKMRCRKYEGTAVGTDIITGEPVSEELYGGYYYSDIPMSNKTDVAKKYLKKWGVK